MSASPQGSPDHVERNVSSVVQLEQSALDQRSAIERLSGVIARFVSTMTFVVLHAAWLAVWIIVNRPTSSLRFDPFPYDILILILATEGILLSTFVLITQNQMTKMADRRAHLNLQISLLTESEMTKVLHALRTISLGLGLPDVANDRDYRDLSRETKVEHVAQAVDEHLRDRV